jgi:hypothetical protein
MTKSRPVTKEEAKHLGQEKVKKIPLLTNKDEAVDTVKAKRQKTEEDFAMKRAIVLNFTRHSEPQNCIDVLKTQYKNVRIFRPIDQGLFVMGTTNTTKTNPLVCNPINTSNKTKSEQIHEWLETYLTTKRDDGLYPLDPMGDYFIILPQKDSQIALEILTALNAIKNIDWYIIWAVYNEHTTQFEIAEIVSTKGVYLSWKKKAASVSDITNRRKQLILSQLSESINKEAFIASLDPEDYKLIEYNLKRKEEENNDSP